MKKIAKKFGLSLAALACVACAGVGVSLTSSKSAVKADAAVAASDFWVASTGIRLVNDANGSGIRFHTNVTTAVYETIVESGTLIIPEVRYDGELTLDDLNNAEQTRPVRVVTKDADTDLWYTFEYTNKDGSTEDVMRSTVYLYELPESMYGARMVAVSYVTTSEGTTYTEIPSATSMADVASKVGESSQYYAQAQPYVVDDVTITYNMPNGSTQIETVAYGSKINGPTYNKSAYEASATDQYGNTIDLDSYEATLPVTLDVELTALPLKNVVSGQLIKGLYSSTAAERAWSNGPNGTAVTEGIPRGYSSMIRLDWYEGSTGQWKVGGNPLYRTQFNQNDISAYDRVTFAMKLETDGDAYVAAKNKAVNLGNNKWLHFELVQTSANVWTLTVTDDAGAELYKVENATADTKTNGSGLSNDYDSVASLVFSRTGYTGAQGGTGWEASHMVALYPCTSAEMTASVYFTEIIGYAENEFAIPVEAVQITNGIAAENGANAAFAIVENTETAPTGFNSVTAYKSEDMTWSNKILNAGQDLSSVNVANYSEVWFAVKMVNGHMTETMPTWNDIDSNSTTPWIYFHLTQTGTTKATNSADTIAWSIEIIKDGVVWDTITDQHTNANDTIARILDYSNNKIDSDADGYDNGRIVFYQNTDNLSDPTYLYSTEVLGVLKDGVEPPSQGGTTEFDPEIPANAVVVRAYPWRDDRYTDGTKAYEIGSANAPAGYTNVLTHTWKSTRTSEYTFCFDTTLDVTQYTDLYVATKIENGTHIYVSNNTSGAHYTGAEWLYVHYHQESTGVWSYDAKAADGYSVASKSTISATTVKGLIEGNVYGHADSAGMGTITYWTEVFGVPASEPTTERAIYSAVDGAILTDDAIGIPTGFTKAYKYENFTMDKFAKMDLTNTIYDTLSFGMLTSANVMIDTDYDDFDGYEPSSYANFRTTTSNAGVMYLVNLVNNGSGSWTVTVNTTVFFDPKAAADGTDLATQNQASFTTTIEGNSLKEIMSGLLQNVSGLTLYCTEVRGTHTCAYNNTKSLGNGYLQDFCICGEAMSDPYEFAHGISDETVMVNDSIWRDNNYALSTPDQDAPAGFENIEMYRWNLNTANGGAAWGANEKDMPLTCLDEADISGYDEVWFAMKNVGGTGFYVRGGSKYTGSDWLYFHLVNVDGAWTLSLSSPDGYVANNVQTGIVGDTLKDILNYNAYSESKPWNSGAYPTKVASDTTTDVKIYFTEILGIISCEHIDTELNYVSNGDGTHNEVCECGTILQENLTCDGTATCTQAAVCSLCGAEHTAALGHGDITWSWGKGLCNVCGESAISAVTVASHAFTTDTSKTELVDNADVSGVTAPAGFSTVVRKDSSTGWTSSALAREAFNQTILLGYSEVWFALKAGANCYFAIQDDSGTRKDYSGTDWLKFHLYQTGEDANGVAIWTIEMYVGETLHAIVTNQTGDVSNINMKQNSIAEMLYDGGWSATDGTTILIYHKGGGTTATLYSTEMLGAFDTGISSYATGVLDYIWNPDYFEGGVHANGSTWSNEAAPAGFDKVTEYTWAGKDFNGQMVRFSESDISGYSDIWFAIKSPDTTNAPIYIQGTSSYAGGGWLYVHYHQVSDGVWTKDYRSADGYFDNTTQTSGNITGTKLTEMISWKSGVNQGSYPTGDSNGKVSTTAYITNVVGVLKCDGINHTGDIIVNNGDNTHDVTCRCGVVISDNVACSGGEATCTTPAECSTCGVEYGEALGHTGGTATCTQGAICTRCGVEYGETIDHSVANYVSNGNGTHNAVCACGAVIESNIACSGGTGNCVSDSICSLCGGTYESNVNHNVAWSGTTGTCTLCGETFYDTGISNSATVVWNHIWNTYYFTGGGAPEGAYADGVAAPEGFNKVSYYTWTSTASNDFPKTGHWNNSTTISNYSDLYFAMKIVNGMDIYIQGTTTYTGGDWLYVHMTQASDGTWSKDFYTLDRSYTAIGIQKGLTGTTLPALCNWVSGINTGSYPRLNKDAGLTATAYFTDVIGVLKCDGSSHTKYEAVSNGDGTHNWLCACGEVAESNVSCAGGTVTCTEVAYCADCGYAYQEALGHNGAWEGNAYICDRCGETVATIDENLAKQNVALFTNASSITANAETPAYITIAEGIDLDSVSNVTLNGDSYVATVEGGKIKINVMPCNVFGEYTLEATVVIKGKSFNITAPVLVVTNMITSSDAMLNMKYILRGKTDTAKVTDTTAQNENVLIYKGGAGGSATMNGDGYYMLGSDVTLTQNDTGGYTDVYVWGTKQCPFVGTFDGNGYVIKNFIKTNWFSDHTLEDASVTSSYAKELEGSLFGYVDGTVKNVAFTNVQLGIYANIVLDGTGVFENVYVEITNLQHNANTYVSSFFWRNTATQQGTMRNVVFNFKNQSSTLITSGSTSTHYPSATGKYYIAENVAAYGFNTSWINANGRGNIYYADAAVDGSAYNIYAEYADGTNNGGTFLQIALSDDIWKIVDGIPYLKNVTVSGTESAPSESGDAVTPEDGVEYSIVWTDTAVPSYESAQFIKTTTSSAIGDLGVNLANLNDFSTKQIIVGSYETYGAYVSHDALVDGATDYGVYTVENTIFVLSETEEGLMYAAKELCRRLYGWNQLTYLAYDAEAIVLNSVASIDTSLVGNYTTQFAFEHRNPANDKGLTTIEKQDFGFTPGSTYTEFVSMHNSANYFGVTSSTTEASHADMAYVPEWSTAATSTFATDSSNALLSGYQLCYTGHGSATTFWAMVDQVVTIVKAKKAAVPTMKVINVMVEDNSYSCECTTCAQFAPSVTQLLFLNAVQKQLNADGVGVGIEFFAYNAYSSAPVLDATASTNLTTFVNTLNASAGSHQAIAVSTATVDYSSITAYTVSLATTVLQAEDGLRLWWTTHEMNHSFPMEHEANAHIYPSLLAWVASIGGRNIDVFAYQAAYRNYFFPLNTWEYQILYYQTLNRLGVNNYMFNLGDVHNPANAQTGFAAFKTYIDSRAMTDVNVDFETLKDEFFSENGYYGAGGPIMRQFFEELVAVYEGHKQGATNQFVSTSTNVQLSTTGGTTGYIATWLYNNADLYYDADDFSNYYDCVRQGFFNGSYGWNMVGMVFGGRQSSTTVTPVTNIYVHSNYTTQQATLEAWYNYCTEALSAVSGADSKYATRINVEKILPEYMYLVYYSTYSTGTSDSAPSVSSKFAGSSSVISYTSYQDFYDRVVALGVKKPSEFYEFNGTGDVQPVYEKWAMFGYTYRYMYENFFKNWGVTVS